MNPAVQKLLAEIAIAKKKAAERRTRAAAQASERYGVLMEEGQVVLRLPPEPEKPTPEDCCGSGCTPCILDTYREELGRHTTSVAEMQRHYERVQSGQAKWDEHQHRSVLATGILDPLRFVRVRVRRVDGGPGWTLLVLEATAADFVLAAGEHVHVRTSNGSHGLTTRPFTPLMLEDDQGVLRPHLFVRLYAQHTMSQQLARVRPGDSIAVRGPVSAAADLTGCFGGQGCVCLVGGGSGVAPLVQLVQYACAHPAYCRQTVVLIHCVTNNGMRLWLQHEIRRIRERMPKFQYHVFVSSRELVPDDVDVTCRRMGEDDLRELAVGPGRAVVCGPPAFNVQVGRWMGALLGADNVQTVQ
ncbi:NADH-cytochrome b5 reductase-like [Coemansia sp. Benny D115]|nr:NADH-cytochrome b5 reductase-like [Coemansia sp. Benny D115]